MNECSKYTFNGVRVCDVIKNARTSAGLTQTALANHFGYSRRSVAAWESGEREPSIAVFLAVMEYCGVCSIYGAFGYETLQATSSDVTDFERKLERLDAGSQSFVKDMLKHEVARVLMAERSAVECI